MSTGEKIKAAVAAGQILPGAGENLAAFLAANLPAWAGASID